jgi:hypothetical protein
MPRVVQPKRKKPPRMPIGKLTPDKSVRYQMRVYGPGGQRFDKSYSTPEMRQRWREQYKAKGFRTRII